MKNKLAIQKSIFIMSLHAMRKKPIRLAITIFLFVCCLTIIGLSVCAAEIDMDKTALDGYNRSGNDILYFAKSLRPDVRREGNNSQASMFSKNDLEWFGSRGIDIDPIYESNGSYLEETTKGFRPFYSNRISGWTVGTDSLLQKCNFKVIHGQLPHNENEVAISLYHYWCFAKFGYIETTLETIPIEKYEDLLGKTIMSDLREPKNSKTLTIVGIIDTRFDEERYALLKEDKQKLSDEDYLFYERLTTSLNYLTSSSLHSALFLHPSFIEKTVLSRTMWAESFYSESTLPFKYTHNSSSLSKISPDDNNIVWIKENHVLADNEIIVSVPDIARHRYLTQDDDSLSYEDYIRKGCSMQLRLDYHAFDENSTASVFKIVGYFDDGYQGDWISPGNYKSTIYFSENIVNSFTAVPDDFGNAQIGAIPLSGDHNKDLALIKLRDQNMSDDYQLALISDIRLDFKTVEVSTNTFRMIGKYIVIVIAVFAALMMFNFIAGTIAAKKKDIGVMRALGASKWAVAEVFFIESLFTSIIAAVISCITTIIGCVLLNSLPTFTIEQFRAFFFTIVPILAVFGVSILIALVGALIPIFKIARKKPNKLIGK